MTVIYIIDTFLHIADISRNKNSTETNIGPQTKKRNTITAKVRELKNNKTHYTLQITTSCAQEGQNVSNKRS